MTAAAPGPGRRTTPRPVEPAGAALRWVRELLGSARIPFLVAGDAAAAAHGAAPAPVARDAALPAAAGGIEIFVAAADLPQLLRLAEAHVAEAPWRRRDERWDRIAVGLEHGRTRITVSLVEAARVRDAATGAWVDAAVDLDAPVARTVWGVTVPVMAWERLVEIERRLGRTLDRRTAGRSGAGGCR